MASIFQYSSLTTHQDRNIEKAKSGTFFTPQKGRGEFQSVILISSFACVK
jgi:hypothetical protein